MLKTKLVVFALIASSLVRADEGMWLPFMLGRNYEDMKKHGLNLTQEQIYSINNSSLKDAIVSFGDYCTAEVISKNGLILTNHHCGYGAIAEVSNKENNHLDNGFWAKDYMQEIPIQGLFVTFVVRMQDVSETVNKELNNSMTEEERALKIEEVTKVLIEDATRGTKYTAVVKDFFEGNEFYLFVKETFNDIRLAGTPPQSAGKYGGDTDNWMWPRHTADFSMFRIYADADNQPAMYSKENKPYNPKHALPISLKGVKKGDFAMILGFPGSTDRYLSSFGVEQAVTLEQPKRVEIRRKKLDIMEKYMKKDTDVRLKYSSKKAQVANYWKYFIGQTAQVKNNDVIGKKRQLESEFKKFAQGKGLYSSVLNDMEAVYKATDKIVNINAYQSEYLYSVDANLMAFQYKFWLDALTTEGQEKRAEFIQMRLGQMMGEFFENKSRSIEAETIKEVLKMYIKDIPTEQMGTLVRKIASKGEKGAEKYGNLIAKKSIFLNKERFDKFNAKPSEKALKKDPLFALIVDINGAHAKATSNKENGEKLSRANRLFVQGLREMQPDKKFYPNANFSMRLTYGNVLPYSPRNGVHYDYITTLDGVMEKEDSSNPEFIVDPKIKELWEKKDFGQYADKSGELVVNFLSNNDITGGNSGSPVINGDGELIGTAFDGNWEAMSGDIFFEPNIQRTISCDIRYVLWLVDKCYGATNLVNEMELRK